MKWIHPSVLVYLVYALIAMIQSWTLLKRLSRTTTTTTTTISHRNHKTRTCAAEEWHLWLGRIGILVLTMGTMMDNSRHGCSVF
jgi:Trk-type K+ transport system membrane component